MTEFFDFTGRVALVTGGSGALGLACARRLREGGARVALLARDEQRLAAACQQLGGGDDVIAVTADVGVSAQVDDAVATVRERLGPVDVLVCSAGGAEEPPDLEDLTDDGWRTMLAANCDGVFYSIRAVLPAMRARDYGRIVVISSIAGKYGNPHEIAYSASKAAVIALVKGLGRRLARTGIRVHAVAPTVIDSPLGTGPDVPADLLRFLLGQVPMGRPGQPREVADLVAFLASERFDYSTGATFDLSGGQATY